MQSKLDEEQRLFFKNWIGLDLEAISWEGRYLDDFNQFWDSFFQIDLSFSELFERLNVLEASLKEGPLIAWCSWLRKKLFSYLFIYHDETISNLSKTSDLPYSDIATLLRDFFVERYPHLEDVFSRMFSVGNILSENLYLNFSKLKENLDLDESEIKGSIEKDVLNSLEITLYSEWKKMQQVFVTDDDKSETQRAIKLPKILIKNQLKFFQELAVLFIVGGLLIFAVKIGNNWYEKYLEEKISLFEPNFFWLDKDLSFKGDKNLKPEDISVSLDQLDELEKIESKKIFEDEVSESRFEVESDVILTSVDALPKDFDAANLEQSNYEEIKKGGFRNNRYGRRKAYRVLLNSVGPRETKERLIKLLEKYGVSQVDNVKPGTEIPGGIYFNLNVPGPFLKEFLFKVSAVEESVILESRTVSRGPSGTNRVFIWIKSI